MNMLKRIWCHLRGINPDDGYPKNGDVYRHPVLVGLPEDPSPDWVNDFTYGDRQARDRAIAAMEDGSDWSKYASNHEYICALEA